jgi:hypothetical protein
MSGTDLRDLCSTAGLEMVRAGEMVRQAMRTGASWVEGAFGMGSMAVWM